MNHHIVSLQYDDRLCFLVIMQEWYILTDEVHQATTYDNVNDAFETISQIKQGLWPVYLKGEDIASIIKNSLQVIPPSKYEKMKNVASVLDN